MLKDLIRSLNNEGLDSNNLVEEFNYLVRDTKLYCFYSIKVEISKDKFVNWFYNNINRGLFDNVDQIHSFIKVIEPWYSFYLERKTLVDKTKSLKSDCKRWYKKNRDERLRGFDRFFEAVLKIFNEAYNSYDIVFYSPDALLKNTQFTFDRKSCYITSKNDYYTLISQMNAFYVVIYRNGEAINRLWAILSTDKKDIAFFNSYGYKFNDFSVLFSSSKEELDEIEYSELEDKIGVYVNRENWLVSKGSNLDNFIHQVKCPCCGKPTYSNSLKWGKDGTKDRLKCDSCPEKVYSSLYDCYLNKEEAEYSYILKTYIFKSDAVFSYYYCDYIPESISVRAYNHTIDDFDWILARSSVYSEYYNYYLIYYQAIYSDYHNTYILKDSPNTVFSKWLNTYVDKNDTNLICVNGDYIPKKDVKKHFIRYKGKYYPKKKLRYAYRFIPERIRVYEFTLLGFLKTKPFGDISPKIVFLKKEVCYG